MRTSCRLFAVREGEIDVTKRQRGKVKSWKDRKVGRLELTSPGVVFSTRRVEKNSRRVEKNSRRVEKNSRRLVKRKSPLCMPWWKRPAKLTGKNHERFMWRVLRARVYTHLISRNKHSPLHTVLVSYWFSKVLSVKALKSKPSHTAKRLWRVGESKPSHRKNVGNQEKNGIKHYCGVKALKSNPSHSKLLNIRRNEALCERVNTFLGIKA